MIRIVAHAEGCVLFVRAQPGARRNAIVGEQAGSLKIAVTAPPDQGRANKALFKIITEQFGLKTAHIELLSGQTSREKKFLLRGLTVDNMEAKLQEMLAAGKDN